MNNSYADLESNIDIASKMATVYPAMFCPGSEIDTDKAGNLDGYGEVIPKIMSVKDQARRLGHRVTDTFSP